MAKTKKRITQETKTATSADLVSSNFVLMDGPEGSKKVPMDLFAGYTAGNGIDITDKAISVDTDVVATQTDLEAKQDVLTAGTNITIDTNNKISATDTTYSAGEGISIDANNVISTTGTSSAEWGDITGTLSDQTDLQTALDAKQDTLTAGPNISITNGTVSTTDEMTVPTSVTVYSGDPVDPLIVVMGSEIYGAEDSSTTVKGFRLSTNGSLVLRHGAGVATSSTSVSYYGIYANESAGSQNHSKVEFNDIAVYSGDGEAHLEADDISLTYNGTTYSIKDAAGKQDALTPGTNIAIENNVISATDTTYSAGTGISIDANNVISATGTASAEWGDITGTLSDQTDLQTALDAKQDTLTFTYITA